MDSNNFFNTTVITLEDLITCMEEASMKKGRKDSFEIEYYITKTPEGKQYCISLYCMHEFRKDKIFTEKVTRTPDMSRQESWEIVTKNFLITFFLKI
jgi:ribosomal protein S26